MRSWMIAGLMGGVALAAMPGGAVPRVEPERAAANSPDQGLCRRARPLPPMPPEPPAGSQQHSRWEKRGGAPMPEPVPMPMTAPPPPAPPAPPPPAYAADAAPALRAETITADDIGKLPDRSTSEALQRVPGVPMAGDRPEPAYTPEPEPAVAPGHFASREPQPRAGLLTAGDHDDLLNPDLYARYVDNFLASETLDGVPRVDTHRVLTVAVKDDSGRPVPFAPVTLTCADGNTLTLATLADGTAAFFPELDRLGSQVRVAVPGGGQRAVTIAGGAGQQLQTLTVAHGAAPVRQFDLALVIDTTGSMSDELEYLKAELLWILGDLRRRHPDLDIRLALIPYRDKGDDYVTITYPFTPNLNAIETRLRGHTADGGGDTPEAVEQAMGRAMTLGWRPGAVKSLLFVADAPPHAEDVAATWRAVEWARAQRIQIVPVAASGVEEGAEYLMRAMAAATQSRYLFLTDDSGIGNLHAPPAIDCYLVTKLDAMIRRTLDSQIAGRRIEPDKGEVIRSVGTYDQGRCVLPPDFARQQQD